MFDTFFILKIFFINVCQLHYILIRFEGPTGSGSGWSEARFLRLANLKLMNAKILRLLSSSSLIDDVAVNELFDLTESSSAWYSGRLCARSKVMASWGRMASIAWNKLSSLLSMARRRFWWAFISFFNRLISTIRCWWALSSSERFCNNLTMQLQYLFSSFSEVDMPNLGLGCSLNFFYLCRSCCSNGGREKTI